jgi:hypothetical protein
VRSPGELTDVPRHGWHGVGQRPIAAAACVACGSSDCEHVRATSAARDAYFYGGAVLDQPSDAAEFTAV